ncbi:flagellar hook-length control protein FliK [Vreelandella alkaliphila]|uniref:Flagellar hook-length control protein FliK n=1 Tax=Vreelandella alkaliphila TaxID=272774 RepID=A0AAJ2VP27_9GAMM|nr:flagellar hook-length control protein FliK [Halomonas alkaliphila]MDX5978087.1 flagellar hook-length control protein FliK [Halomonas alkaliphila]
MTIELLLSMQGQGANSSSSSSAAPGSPRATQGMFLQAFTQAASYQARTLTDTPAENTPTVPLSDIVKQLASFDSELDEETLSNIVATVSAQGQTADIFSSGADSVAPAQTLEMASAAQEQVRTPEQASSSPASEGTETTQTTTRVTIEEVASRLALIESYSTPPTATNAAGSNAQPTNPATPSAATGLSKATTQTSHDQLASANTLTAATSFLDRTTLAMPAALSVRALATEPTPLAQTQGQDHTQALSAHQPPRAQAATTVTTNSAVSPANGQAAMLPGTVASAAPRDVQVAQTGERVVAETSRTTTQATASQPMASQATAQSALSTPTSGSPQGLSSAPSAGSATLLPPVTANGTAATLQDAPTSVVPRDGQVALTGERVALTPQPTIQATTTQTAAQSAPSTPTSESLQGRSPAPSAGSATLLPPVTANSTAATLQGTPASAAPQDGQVALTGERVALTPQPTIQATATQTTAQPALSTPTSGSPQGLSSAPSAGSATLLPPVTANGTAATLQDAPTSVVPRDGQVVQAGERVVAETSQAMTQASTNAAALVMPPLPANSSATSSATTLPNNTGELAQSAVGSSLPSALAATAQQAVGVTNAPRPTPSSVKALPAEAATTPVNTPTLAASLETIPAQPFTSMQPGMHALSPLNTALAPAVNADAVASLFAEAETASVTSGASKGSEQVLPASLTSQSQAMPNSPATATLNTPLNSPAWPSQLGQQLIQFAQRGGEHQVKMQLHPAELGPLSITLKVTEQGTQAHFLSSHAPVRQAIEQAIPQLREALAEQGISLGETSVGEQQNPNEQAFAQQTPGKAAGNRGGELGNDSAPSPTEVDVQGSQDGRVDLYA